MYTVLLECYCTLNRLPCSVKMILCALGNQKVPVTVFAAIFALLPSSGIKPTVSRRPTCQGEEDGGFRRVVSAVCSSHYHRPACPAAFFVETGHRAAVWHGTVGNAHCSLQLSSLWFWKGKRTSVSRSLLGVTKEMPQMRSEQVISCTPRGL